MSASTILRQATITDIAQLASLRYEFRASIGTATESEEAFATRMQGWLQRHMADRHWVTWVAQDINI